MTIDDSMRDAEHKMDQAVTHLKDDLAGIRTGRASATEAVDSVFGRLHRVNPAINAVVQLDGARLRFEHTHDGVDRRVNPMEAAKD